VADLTNGNIGLLDSKPVRGAEKFMCNLLPDISGGVIIEFVELDDSHPDHPSSAEEEAAPLALQCGPGVPSTWRAQWGVIPAALWHFKSAREGALCAEIPVSKRRVTDAQTAPSSDLTCLGAR
jgi:hypothetical protein